MFDIGDKIVYPMHGAGVIDAIEEKEILNEIRRYYILNVSCGDMKVMIPIDSCEVIGVRSIVDEETLDGVVEVLKNDSTEMSNNWNRRNRDNMELLKTGDINAVAEVVRNLMRIDGIKKLSTGEKKMLSTSIQILVSEMILVKDIDEKTAEKKIKDAVLNN